MTASLAWYPSARPATTPPTSSRARMTGATRRDPARAAAEGVAVNAADSGSGRGALADAGLGGPALVTGSHAASMRAVACRAAHPAAIDAVIWALLPHPGLRIRATTPPRPPPRS